VDKYLPQITRYLSWEIAVTVKFFPEPDIKLFITTQQSNRYAVLLAISSLLHSIGFLIGTPTEQANYQALYSIMPNTGWAFCFFVYSGTKFMQTFKLSATWFQVVASVCLGIWLWTSIFVSVVLLDPRQVAPLELLLITPLFIECYQLALDIYKYKAAKTGRRST
jgi:hypothetical protein